MMKKRLLVAATEQPVGIDEVKLNSRNDDAGFTEHDALILAQIATATAYAEKSMGRVLMPQQWLCSLDVQSYEWLLLPVSPVQSVVVKYIDTAGQEQTLSPTDYELDLSDELSRIRLSKTINVASQINAITFTVSAGYTTADIVPIAIKQAIIILASHFYENPTGVAAVNLQEVPASFDALLDLYKIYR